MTIKESSIVRGLRNLNARVECAIAQSRNENIASIKVLSSKQLRSGDLGIRTATSKEVEIVQRFTGEWVHHIGNEATLWIMTYGIIAHGMTPCLRSGDHTHKDSSQHIYW